MFNTPILFLIFNRPETTYRVFEEIKKQKPKHLFIAADGPRPDKQNEAEICTATRNIILKDIDWDCEIKTLFREKNIGCRSAVQGALDWFFDQVDEGIILEDDTLPNDFFFKYCSILLERYRNNPDIFSINGCNLGYSCNDYDYGLTKYFNMWGWATWKRSYSMVKKNWKLYEENPDILKDKEVKRWLKLPTVWDNRQWYEYWQLLFSKTAAYKVDTWDYQWIYTVLKTNSFCVMPARNMVLNIGFSANATHTIDPDGVNVIGKLTYGIPDPDPSLKSGFMDIDKRYETEFNAKIWHGYNPFRRSVAGRIYFKVLKILSFKKTI